MPKLATLLLYLAASCNSPRFARSSESYPNPTSPAAGQAAPFANVFDGLEQRSEDLARLAGERGTAGAFREHS